MARLTTVPMTRFASNPLPHDSIKAMSHLALTGKQLYQTTIVRFALVNHYWCPSGHASTNYNPSFMKSNGIREGVLLYLAPRLLCSISAIVTYDH